MNRGWAAYLAAAAVSATAAALPGTAQAAHGKAGLWLVQSWATAHSKLPLKPGQAVPAPPSFFMLWRVRCVQAAEVASNDPPPPNTNECTYANLKHAGTTFSGDQICHGTDFDGRGHFSITYDSDTHYTGTTTMSGKASLTGLPVNQPLSMTYATVGKWIKADCGQYKNAP